MENTIKINKDYQLSSDFVILSKSNHREQLWLLYTLHILTGDTGNKLIDTYIDLTLPLSNNYTKQKYHSVTSHRYKKKQQLRILMNQYFTVTDAYGNVIDSTI